MALTQEELLSITGVLVLLFGAILYNNFKAAKATKALAAQKAGMDAPSASGSEGKPWTGRYLQHEGDVVGQVVAVEGDTVYVRKGATTLGVPRSQVREQGADLGLTGSLDADAAAKAGAAWKA